MNITPHPSDLDESRAQLLKQIFKLGRDSQMFNEHIINDVFVATQMDEHAKRSALLSFEELASLSQNLILQAKRLFASIPEMVHYFEKNSRPGSNIESCMELFSAVSAFALQLESPEYTEVSHWLGPWFKDDDDGRIGFVRDDRRFRLYETAHLAVKLQQFFGSAMHGKTPEMFVDGQYRGIRVQNRLFSLTMHNHLLKVIGESRESEKLSRYWVSKLKEVESNDPDGWPILKSELTSKLLTYDLEGLDGLRLQTLGYTRPEGGECSNRVDELVRNIVFGQLNANIKSQVRVISSNKLYRQEALVDDLIEVLDDFHRHYRQNDGGDTFTGGEASMQLMTELFREFKLTPEELSIIALRSAASFNRGAGKDLQQKPLQEQFKATMDRFRDQHVMNAGELNYVVLCAVIKNLPKKILSRLASYSDDDRASIYKITGSAQFLAGIKDSKMIDDLMGTDLGL